MAIAPVPAFSWPRAIAALRRHGLPARSQAADYTGPLFDAHLHYNDEAQVRRTRCPTCWRECSATACSAIVANSRPNDGTMALASSPLTRAGRA